MKRHLDAVFILGMAMLFIGLISWQTPDGYTWSGAQSPAGEQISLKAQQREAIDEWTDTALLRRGKTEQNIVAPQPELAAMFVVNTNTDEHDNMPGDGICNSGTGCSLRAAIEESNALPGADTITFNIPPLPGVSLTIAPLMPYPAITDPVTINATTQPGFMGNPLIELNGTNAGATDGLVIQAGNSVVRGLVINRFNGNGIVLAAIGNNIIEGNFIGTDRNGTMGLGNSASGILITSPSNTIGGTAPGAGNLISGNDASGIQIFSNLANGCLIQGNLIGTTASGISALGNGGSGVDIFDGSNNAIGGTAAGAANTIAFNSANGITVLGTATGDRLLTNSIFSNSFLGIGLADDGVTPNDPGDLDTGPNNLQNFPLLTSAMANMSSIMIQGTLNSRPNATYRVEFFSNPNCDPSGNGEGQTFIGSSNVMTNGSGDATINIVLPVTVQQGQSITSTATDQAGNTSEFSACVTVTPLVCNITCPANLTVSNDTGQCGAVVAYPSPVTNGSCGTVTCNPPSGSFFPTGVTTVTCLTSLGPACSFTITVEDDEPPVITCPPDQTVQATSPAGAAVNYPPPAVSDNCPGANAVCNPPSGSQFPIGTTTVTCVATDGEGNTANCMFTVMVTPAGGCTITCPPDQTISVGPDQCSAVVNYPAPRTMGDCGNVTCVPPSGSVFPLGVTFVNCSVAGGPNCSFMVTVKDDTPPAITCPGDIMVSAAPAQQSAVVNYPLPRISDNCPGASSVCVPPSGTVFPLGVTTITCTAKDLSGNQALCQFTITVQDRQAPTIACPSNVAVDAPLGQNSVPVNYPNPVVSDNLPGTIIVCVPPSGSAFPVGISTVTCTATDVAGNQSVCRFTITVKGAGAQIDVQIEGGKQAIEFGDESPVKPRRKIKKRTPCENFSIENVGFASVTLTLDAILRTGSDVVSGRITDPDDPLFALSIIGAGGAETPVQRGGTITLAVGASVDLCLRFNPVYPRVADRTDQLSASDVVPDPVTSQVVFRFNGNQEVIVNIRGHVAGGLTLINATNPRRPADVTFTKSGNEFILNYSVYDPDLDVGQAKYELLGAGGQAAQSFQVNLAQALGPLNLVKGQSFSVRQRFTGANDHPEITGLRLTVMDGETSVTATVSLGSQAASAVRLQFDGYQDRVRALLPPLRLGPE